MPDGQILEQNPLPTPEIHRPIKPIFIKESVRVSDPLKLTEVPEIGKFKDYIERQNQKIHTKQLQHQKIDFPPEPTTDKRYMLPESEFPDDKNELGGLMRPDFLRGRLLELHKELSEFTASFPLDVDLSQVESVNTIIKEMEKLDNIAKQFMQNQREIKFNFKDQGEMSSHIVRIDSQSENAKNKRVIIYGGGYGTDLRGIAPALQAIASLNRDVVGVSFPDSYRGMVTGKFFEDVKNSRGMEAHAEYFKHVIRQIKAEYPNREIELAGNSTFALVIAHMLEDQKFVEEMNIAAASCIGSAGAYDVGALRQQARYAGEVMELTKRRTGLAQYAYVKGSKDVEPNIYQDAIRNRVWDEVKKRTHKKQEAYDYAEVKKGGHIYFVTGGEDNVTKDYLRFTENKGQWVIVHNPKGRHQDINSDAYRLFQGLFREQEKYEK